MQMRIQQGLIPDAKDIREEVFMKEQGFHQEFDEVDETAWHLVLYEKGEAVGCCRLFPSDEPDVFILGRLAVRKSCRGRHYGERIVQEAERWLRGRHVKKLALSAQVRVQPFYEMLGYTASGDVYLDEYCPHIHMEKELFRPFTTAGFANRELG